jgi:hypothetical protein
MSSRYTSSPPKRRHGVWRDCFALAVIMAVTKESYQVSKQIKETSLCETAKVLFKICRATEEAVVVQ